MLTIFSNAKVKGATCTSRFVHLEKISLNFSSLSFAILVNLHHPCSLLVYSCLFVFVYPGKLLFKGFPPINNNVQRTKKQLKNIVTYTCGFEKK